MKTFKQFFTELNYDIWSIPQGGDEPDELGTVPDSGLQAVQRIVKSTSNEQLVTKILKKKLYSEKSFREGEYGRLVNRVGDLDVSYLKILNSSKLPKLSDNKLGQLSLIGEQIKIPWTALDPIHKFVATDATGSAIGAGEILIALLFKDVTNSTSGGDLMLSGKNKIEVKGELGRLGSQARAGRTGINEQDFINIPNHNVTWQQQILDDSRAGKGHDVASILSNAVNQSNDKKTVVQHFQHILNKLYPESDINNLLANETAIQDHGTAKKTLFKINTDHYINLHGIQEILTFNAHSKYIVMNREEAFTHIDNEVFTTKGNFLVYDWAPNIRIKV